jgi:hypothetical protein
LRTACDTFGRDENVLIMSVGRPEKMRLLGHASIDWKIVLNVSSVCSLLALALTKHWYAIKVHNFVLVLLSFQEGLF